MAGHDDPILRPPLFLYIWFDKMYLLVLAISGVCYQLALLQGNTPILISLRQMRKLKAKIDDNGTIKDVAIKILRPNIKKIFKQSSRYPVNKVKNNRFWQQ